MKKTLLLLLTIAGITAAHAQIPIFQKRNKANSVSSADKSTADSTSKANAVKEKPQAILLPTSKPVAPKRDWSKVDLSHRTADHFMIQYGYDGWIGVPDTIRTKGFGRHFNIYFMIDKPFKTDKRFSWGLGAGLGSSNIFFDKQKVDLNSTGATLAFPDQSNGSSYFKKFKLTTIFLEIPGEVRYYSNPENTDKSWKFAAGLKLGLLVKGYTKGKDEVNSNGQTIYGSSYIEKESNTRYLNSFKVASTIRAGYGIFSIHGDFQITQVIKAGAGPGLNPFSIGLSISGL